jgi:hypothetical protein
MKIGRPALVATSVGVVLLATARIASAKAPLAPVWPLLAHASYQSTSAIALAGSRAIELVDGEGPTALGWVAREQIRGRIVAVARHIWEGSAFDRAARSLIVSLTPGAAADLASDGPFVVLPRIPR